MKGIARTPSFFVRELMTQPIAVVHTSDSLRVAATAMRVRDLGFLPVVDDERVVGVLTDRDLTVRATAAGLDPSSTTVDQVMTPDVIYCFDDETVGAAAAVMEAEGVRRLVVFDRKMKLVGVLTLDDLAAVPSEALPVGQTLGHLT